MWNVPPEMMCDKHLLGEHLEMHMFIGCIQKHKSIEGYIQGGLVEVQNIKKRHDVLVIEMLARKMNHNTPILDIPLMIAGKVDARRNAVDLMSRCLLCRVRADKITNLRK